MMAHDGQDEGDIGDGDLLLSPPLELLLLRLLFFSGDLLRLRLSFLLSLGLLDLSLLSFFFPFFLSSLLYSFLLGELERDLSRSYLLERLLLIPMMIIFK